MPVSTLTVGGVEITAILDVDTSMPLFEVFDGNGDAPTGRIRVPCCEVPERVHCRRLAFPRPLLPDPNADTPDLD